MLNDQVVMVRLPSIRQHDSRVTFAVVISVDDNHVPNLDKMPGHV